MPPQPNIPRAPIRNGHVPPERQMIVVVPALVLCLPLGVVALCHSLRVERLWHAGEREAARRASEAAMVWSVRALLVPVLLFAFFMLYWAFFALNDKYEVETHNLRMRERVAERAAAEEQAEEENEGQEGAP